MAGMNGSNGVNGTTPNRREQIKALIAMKGPIRPPSIARQLGTTIANVYTRTSELYRNGEILRTDDGYVVATKPQTTIAAPASPTATSKLQAVRAKLQAQIDAIDAVLALLGE